MEEMWHITAGIIVGAMLLIIAAGIALFYILLVTHPVYQEEDDKHDYDTKP